LREWNHKPYFKVQEFTKTIYTNEDIEEEENEGGE